MSESAYVTLAARALEHRRPDSIFRDQAASNWHLAVGGPEAADLDPTLINGIILRTILFDYAVLDFVAAHQRPIIFDLGCGFGTRLYRLNPSKVVMWFNCDLPVIMRVREQLERPMSNTVEMNLDTDLSKAGWIEFSRSGGEVLVVLEGVLSYLELKDAIRLIDYLRRRFPGSLLLGTAPQQVIGGHLWSARDINSVEVQLDLHVVRSWKLDEIANRMRLSEEDSVTAPIEGLLFEGLLV